jgi:hypothetical protein
VSTGKIRGGRGLSFGRGAALAIPVAALGILSLTFGCGDSDEGSGGSSSTGSSGEFSCCLNGDGYSCPDKEAFDQCSGFDYAACDSACGPTDGACHQGCAEQAANATHDPSGCDPDPNAAACDISGSSSSGGSCTPSAIGCDSSAECCEGLSCVTDPDSGTNGTFCL